MTLPDGTVTFLFTDIEGSTRLWEEQPGTMPLALARHIQLIVSAVEQHGGQFVRTRGEGDSTFSVFVSAAEAVAAACAFQRALTAEAWPERTSIRVRAALHTGTAHLTDGDYNSSDVNRCARIRAIAFGAQTLLSQAVYDQVKESLPAEVTLRDMGLQRLKDLRDPEQVYQICHPALPDDFPSLRSLNNPTLPNNLPQQVTSFIGREKEMTEIRELLARTRLLTLTGSGGCGKTRLALQTAADLLDAYPEGVWLVELAPLADPALVVQAVANVLAVREVPAEPLIKTLTGVLKDRQMLLILDNCEHVLEESARLADTILRDCPKVKLLASSRETLGIAGESSYRIPSLSLPSLPSSYTSLNRGGQNSVFSSLERGGHSSGFPALDKEGQNPVLSPLERGGARGLTLETVCQCESVQLFIERAVAAKTGFTVTDQNVLPLAAVCHRLDGIPLAIELAAARVRSLTVEELGSRLEDRFRILTGGSRTALPRQQTLRALIDWSYDLLEESQKALLCRLSVFTGGWTLEAAEAVCMDTGIGCQVSGVGAELEVREESRKTGMDQSLTLSSQYPTPDTRHPTPILESWEILDLLTSLVDKSLVVAEEEGDVMRYRLLETVRQYAREKLASQENGGVYRRQHRDYYLTLAEEVSPKLFGAEQQRWLKRLEREHDNLRLALQFSADAMAEERREAGLRLCTALWWFWSIRGHLSEGRAWCTQMLSQPGAGESTEWRAKALHAAGGLALGQSDYPAAKALYEECLSLQRELGNKQGIAMALGNLGTIVREQGDHPAAQALFEETLSLFREMNGRQGIANSINNLGILAYTRADYTAARALYEEGVALYRELGNQYGEATALNNLGNVMNEQGDYTAARAIYQESLILQKELENKLGIANALTNLGRTALHLSDYTEAQKLLEESLSLWQELGNRLGIAITLNNLGTAAHRQGDDTAASRLYEESMRQSHSIGHKRGVVESVEFMANHVLRRTQPERAIRLWGAVQRMREDLNMPSPPRSMTENQRMYAEVRAAIGEEAFDRAFEEGGAMSMEQAVEYALSTDGVME